jgi:hypothetical protein
MWKRIDLETKLGGLFGLIAITAIVIEMALNSFSSEVLITGIRDMAGTMVGVMVFIIAIKSITRNSLKNLS